MSMSAIVFPGSRMQVVPTSVSAPTPVTGSPYEPLTRKEKELLHLLLENAGRCVSRETLLRRVWNYSEGTRTRTVDVHVQRLRRKLGAAAKSLKTIVRQGYCWLPEQNATL